MMQEGQSRQKHPKCASQNISKGARVSNIQVFDQFSSLYFWQKAMCLRTNSQKAWWGATSTWQPEPGGGETGMGTFSNGPLHRCCFSCVTALWWAGYSPQLWWLKWTTKKKGIWEAFPSETDMHVPIWKCFILTCSFLLLGMGREKVGRVTLDLFCFRITKLLMVFYFSVRR